MNFVTFVIVFYNFVQCDSYFHDITCLPGESCVSISECEYLRRLFDTNNNGNSDTYGLRRISQTLLNAFWNAKCSYDSLTNQTFVCCRNQMITPKAASTLFKPTVPMDLADHQNLQLLPNFEHCGTPIVTCRPREENGEMSVYKYPWLAMLRYDTGRKLKGVRHIKENGCGGSLINQDYILTSAECVTNLKRGIKLSSAILGKYDVQKDVRCDVIKEHSAIPPPIQEILVESVHFPQHFRNSEFGNLVALVRLKHPANLSYYNVQPICLPTNSKMLTFQFDVSVTAGWSSIKNP